MKEASNEQRRKDCFVIREELGVWRVERGGYLYWEGEERKEGIAQARKLARRAALALRVFSASTERSWLDKQAV